MRGVVGLVGVLFLLAIAGCAPGAVLAVDLEDLPQDVERLEIRIRLPDEEDLRPARSLLATRKFDVWLPTEARGTVYLLIEGVSPHGCVTAQAEENVTIHDAERYPLAIRLTSKPGCLLRVKRLGEGSGRVHIAPQGLECKDWDTNCEAQFPGRERTTELRADLLDESSYFLGWTGACTRAGNGSCQLNVGAGTTEIGAMFLPRQVCGPGGFCSEYPRPTGELLYRIWGSYQPFEPPVLWALGVNGYILRGDGRVFAPLPRVSRVLMEDLHGSGADDVWAVGLQGTIFHWGGQGWLPVDSGTKVQLNSVWAFSKNEAYVVGKQGTILRWDGKRWQSRRSVTDDAFNAVWGSKRADGSTDLWMVGQNGVVVRGDGESFRIEDRPGAPWLQHVWGSNQNGRSDPELVLAVGPDCTVVRFPGPERMKICESRTWLATVWGSSVDDIWIGGSQGGPGGEAIVFRKQSDGRFAPSYRNGHLGTGIYSIWGSGPGDVWMAGGLGSILHHDGVATTSFAGEASEQLWGVYAIASDDVWAVGSGGRILHFQGQTWAPVQVNAPTNLRALYAVWASGPNNVWAVGESSAGGEILRFDGERWKFTTVTDVARFHAVWGNSAGEVWVGGSSASIVRFVQSGMGYSIAFSRKDSKVDGTIRGIAGSGPNDVRFLGPANLDGGQVGILTGVWNGTQLQGDTKPLPILPYNLYYHRNVGYVAVGTRPARVDDILRDIPAVARSPRTAEPWVEESVQGELFGTELGTSYTLWGAFGTTLENLVAVATNGAMAVRRGDGTWFIDPFGRPASSVLRSVHGLPTGQAWAVGFGGLILHRPAGAAGKM